MSKEVKCSDDNSHHSDDNDQISQDIARPSIAIVVCSPFEEIESLKLENLKYSSDSSHHSYENVQRSKKEDITRGSDETLLAISEVVEPKLSSIVRIYDSGVGSEYTCSDSRDSQLSALSLIELSIDDEPELLPDKRRQSDSERDKIRGHAFLEITQSDSIRTRLPESIYTKNPRKLFPHTKEFSRHYHLYYGSYTDFLLPRLFQIFILKFLQSDWFPRIISKILHFYKSFVDGNTTTNDDRNINVTDPSEKETCDEKEQDTFGIMREFKSAYETQEWAAFDFMYRCSLLMQETTIFVLRGVMRETLCNFVKENIEQNVKTVYFGYCLQRRKTVLVVIIDNVFFDKEMATTYRGLPILYKQWTEITEESVKTRQYEGNEYSLGFKEDVHVKIHECLMQNSAILMKSHSNIEIICASPYRSMDNGKMIHKEDCILIYCTMKNVIPLGEMCFAEKLGGFKIDVREGFFYRYPRIENESLGTFVAPTDRHAELKIGAEISRKDGNVKGTLGGFVKIGDKGDIGFITCAHVLHDEPELMIENDAKVVQPSYGLLETNDVCGYLIKSVHPTGFDKTTVDASLVQVDSSRKPTRISFTGLRKDQIRKLGFSPNEIYSGEILENATINAPCYKSGATTNFTIGKLEGRSLTAKYLKDFRDPSQESVFYDQYVVSPTSFSPFASSGDSGAFVFQCLENSGTKSYACIGMIVGGTSDSKVVVTPIREVLNALDMRNTTKLCTFEDEKMETDEKSMCCVS